MSTQLPPTTYEKIQNDLRFTDQSVADVLRKYLSDPTAEQVTALEQQLHADDLRFCIGHGEWRDFVQDDFCEECRHMTK